MEGELKPCDSCGALVGSLTLAESGEHLCPDCYRVRLAKARAAGTAKKTVPAGRKQPDASAPPREKLSVPVVLWAVLALLAILSLGGAFAAFLLVPARFGEDIPIGAISNGVDRLSMLLAVLIGVAAIIGLALLRIEEKLDEFLRRTRP